MHDHKLGMLREECYYDDSPYLKTFKYYLHNIWDSIKIRIFVILLVIQARQVPGGFHSLRVKTMISLYSSFITAVNSHP